MPTIIDPNLLCPKCMHISQVPERVCPRCRTDKTTAFNRVEHLPIGTILNGKYYVGSVLGQGGFGITYCACDLTTGEKKALKEYFPQNCVSRQGAGKTGVMAYSGEAEEFFRNGMERFYREAKALERFAHLECVIGVRDYFQANGTAYIVMDFAEGMNLKQMTAKRGRMDFATVLEILRPLIADLCEIHENHIIHRDIKPDNIMISPEGKAVLIDFGAARESGGTSTKLSVIHDYAPLEQHQNTAQGSWTDVYAMCATLYEQATGQLAPRALERLLYNQPVPKPSALGADIPRHVENAIMAGLALQPKERTQTMRELYNGLYKKTRTATVRSESKTIRPAHSGKKKSGKIGVIAGAAAALVVGIGLLAAGSLSTPVNTPAFTQPPQTITAVPAPQMLPTDAPEATSAPAAEPTATRAPTPVPTEKPTATPVPQMSDMTIEQAVIADGKLYVLDGKTGRVVECSFDGGMISSDRYLPETDVQELRQSDGVVYGLSGEKNAGTLLWMEEKDASAYFSYADDPMFNYAHLTDGRISGQAVVLLMGRENINGDYGFSQARIDGVEYGDLLMGGGNAAYWTVADHVKMEDSPVLTSKNGKRSKMLENITAVALHGSFGMAVTEKTGGESRDGKLFYWGTPPEALRKALNLTGSTATVKQYTNLKGSTLQGNQVSEMNFAGFDVISLGSATFAAITDQGGVVMAGDNSKGQLGIAGKDADNPAPMGLQIVDLQLNGDTPKEVFCMEGYTLLLTEGHKLFGWGDVPGVGTMTPAEVQPGLRVADFSPSDGAMQVLVTMKGELVVFGGGESFRTLLLSDGG